MFAAPIVSRVVFAGTAICVSSRLNALLFRRPNESSIEAQIHQPFMGNKTLHSAQENAGLACDGKVSLRPTRLRVRRTCIAVRIPGEAIHFCFVPVKVLLEEVGKSAGNWYSVQHFLAAFLPFFVVYKDKIFYSRNSA